MYETDKLLQVSKQRLNQTTFPSSITGAHRASLLGRLQTKLQKNVYDWPTKKYLSSRQREIDEFRLQTCPTSSYPSDRTNYDFDWYNSINKLN